MTKKTAKKIMYLPD